LERDVKASYRDVTSDSWIKLSPNFDVNASEPCMDMTSDSSLPLSANFACLPRESGKARALEIDLRRA